MEDGELQLLDPRFTDPLAAAEYLESIRWPNGPVCPHCGDTERSKRINVKGSKRRLWKCYACRKQFTVMVGTIFESSHVPLNKWLAAFYLLCASKKGMSAHQLHRMLGVTYKTAWFIFHRVREAMKDPAFTSRLSGTVEADETYIGGKKSGRGTGRGTKGKTPVMTLVERDGRARSFRMANVTADELGPVIRRHVDPSARLMTDEWLAYRKVGKEFSSHETVAHSMKEYARGDVTTNTVEGYFGNLKRGINGVYHHVSRAHLDRYLAEFDFRYNARHVNDSRRTVTALAGAEGKRLKYRNTR